MIYRRENPTTPSKRFRSMILNPIGQKICLKHFYMHNNARSLHNGRKLCKRRKNTVFNTRLNITKVPQKTLLGFIEGISIVRRYKTFVGLVRYSNGSINCLRLFNGAYISHVISTFSFIKTPKIYYFNKFTIGSTVPLLYLNVTACFFNVIYDQHHSAYFGLAGGTYCILARFNFEKNICVIKLPSSKLLKVSETTYVTLGRNSNTLIKGIWLGTAGRNIIRGFRPNVRGVAKNPVDHPHGGRTKTNSPERTPWGRIAKFNK